ncbi:hypothetical protein L1887_12262 [Cichorium endivia]|nr:hypothetical protein L1887_12262 [Cichorium endivia]
MLGLLNFESWLDSRSDRDGGDGGDLGRDEGASIAISDKHVCHSSFSPTPPFLFPLSSPSAHDFPLLNNLLRNLLIFFVLHIRIGSKKSLFRLSDSFGKGFLALHPSIQVVALISHILK